MINAGMLGNGPTYGVFDKDCMNPCGINLQNTSLRYRYLDGTAKRKIWFVRKSARRYCKLVGTCPSLEISRGVNYEGINLQPQ